MKEEIFISNRKKIIHQTFFIWLWIITHLMANLWVLTATFKDGKITALIIINVFFSYLSILGLIIFFRYYKHSYKKKFIITYNTLKYYDEISNRIIELQNHEITEIKFVTNSVGSKLPWSSMEYFSLADKNGNEIVITSFMMNITDFWLSTLTKKASSKNFIRKEVLFPIFQLQTKA